MRAHDMTVGEAYALRGHRRIKVTYLPTPPEVRTQRRVRVRFETGVIAGRVSDVPTIRIEGRWERLSTPAPERKPPARRPNRAPTTVDRPARVDDTVVLTETGELAWTVATLDEPAGEVTVKTEIFGQPRERRVPLTALRVLTPERPRRLSPVRPPEPRSSRAAGVAADSDEDAALRLRPVTPRRDLDELMDDVLFTQRCLEQYARRLGNCKPRVANDRLREEVRRAGFVLRDAIPVGEYARIRVLGRFDIVLRHRPSPEAPVHVDRLRMASRKGGRGSRGQQPRPRRAA